MRTRRITSLSNQKYKVVLYLEEFTELETKLMKKFGEPEIDVGGSFTGPPAFTLDSDLKKIRAESPFEVVFDGQSDIDAQDKATAWRNEMTTRINTAITDLLVLNDTFSGEDIVPGPIN